MMEHLGWYALRATGLTAVAGLWLALVFGLGLAGRGLGGWIPAPAAGHLHRYWSVLGTVATLAHAVVATLAPGSTTPPVSLLVPGLGADLPRAMALGTVATWMLLAVALSSAFRSWLPPGAWRALHASALGAWVLGLAHAWRAGSDLDNPVARALLVAATVTVPVLLGLRAVSARRAPPSRPPPSS